MEDLKTISDVKTFSDWEQAAQYLKATEVPCCQVITSGTNGEFLVKEISQLQNICSIHIFCGNIDYHKEWSNQYTKVISVDNKFNQLKANLEKKLVFWQRDKSSLRINLPSYAPIFDDAHKSKNTYLHYYLKGFVHFQNREQAKNDLLDLAKALFGKDQHVQDFEKNYDKYNMKDILKWYTRECFLYKVTNNCLRISTPDSIQYSRLVLRDLEQAIKEKYQQQSKNFSGLLYRGAYINDQEWTDLVSNIGKDIEFYGFLSTSKDKMVAQSFIMDATDKKAMITIIVPAAPDKGDQGFAEIKEYSDFKYEEEVLFNVMSRFTILEAKIEDVNKGTKCRHLVLLYGAQAMKKFTLESSPIQITTKDLKRCHICAVDISSLKSPLILVNPDRCDEYSCLDCFEKYKSENKSAFICLPQSMSKKSLNLEIKGFVMKNKDAFKIPFYRSRCHKCDNRNLKYYSKCVDCEEKKEYCEKCFYQNDCIQQGHLLILETHPFSFWSEKMSEKELHYLSYYQIQLEQQESATFQQALIFENTHNYTGVIEYITKFLEKHGNKNDSITASSFIKLGNTYKKMGNYQKAIQFHSKALELSKTVFGEEHSDTAGSYHNVGNVYADLGEYQKAIQFHSKALEIQRTVLGDQHRHTAACYVSLGLGYFYIGEYQKAIQFQSKALEIQVIVLGDQHPDTAGTYNNLGLVYAKLGDYKKTIEFRSKALEIKKTTLGDQHPDTATSYNNLGNAYFYVGEYQKAIQFYSKSLEIQETVLGDQHPDTSSSYMSLGNAYVNLGECQKAIQYYSKALEIQETVFGKQHSTTANSYHNLGNAYVVLGEYKRAIEYASKSLQIRQIVLGDHHPDTASSYSTIGIAYKRWGEYLKGIEYLSKALEIETKVLGDKHPTTAKTYKNLGDAYSDLGEYEKAIQYYSSSGNQTSSLG